MKRTTLVAGLFGAFALAGAALASPNQAAAEALPAAVAHRLDGQAVEFTMTAAKQRRLMMMQEATRQQRYGRGAYGRGAYGRGAYGRGYGAGPRYGYGRGYGPQPGSGRFIYRPGYGVRPY